MGPEQRLVHYCRNNPADIFLITSAVIYGDDLAGYERHCEDSEDGREICEEIGEDITECQNMGKSIVLAITGELIENYEEELEEENFEDARELVNDYATALLNRYTYINEANRGYRPFGDAVVDGFFLDYEASEASFVPELSAVMAERALEFIWAFEVKCDSLELSNRVLLRQEFDYGIVLFSELGSKCNIHDEFNWPAWEEYSRESNYKTEIFAGISSARTQNGDDFVDAEIPSEKLPMLMRSQAFAGFAVEDAAMAENNNFISQVRDALSSAAQAPQSSSVSEAVSLSIVLPSAPVLSASSGASSVDHVPVISSAIESLSSISSSISEVASSSVSLLALPTLSVSSSILYVSDESMELLHKSSSPISSAIDVSMSPSKESELLSMSSSSASEIVYLSPIVSALAASPTLPSEIEDVKSLSAYVDSISLSDALRSASTTVSAATLPADMKFKVEDPDCADFVGSGSDTFDSPIAARPIQVYPTVGSTQPSNYLLSVSFTKPSLLSASGAVSTIFDVQRTVVTITHCDSMRCSEQVITTGVPAPKNDIITPKNDIITPKTEERATSTAIKRTVITVTSCGPEKLCTAHVVTTGVTTVTSNEVVYTTYCPLPLPTSIAIERASTLEKQPYAKSSPGEFAKLKKFSPGESAKFTKSSPGESAKFTKSSPGESANFTNISRAMSEIATAESYKTSAPRPSKLEQSTSALTVSAKSFATNSISKFEGAASVNDFRSFLFVAVLGILTVFY